MVDSSFIANDDLVKKKTFGSDLDPPLHNVIRVGGRFIPHASGRAHIIPYPRSMPRRMDHVVCPTQFRVHYAYKYICIHRIDNILAFITTLSWSVFYKQCMIYESKKTFLLFFNFSSQRSTTKTNENLRLYYRYETKSRLYFASTFDLYVIIETRKHIPIVIGPTKRTRRTLTHKLIPSFSVSTNSLSYYPLSLWVVVLDER